MDSGILIAVLLTVAIVVLVNGFLYVFARRAQSDGSHAALGKAIHAATNLFGEKNKTDDMEELSRLTAKLKEEADSANQPENNPG